MAKKLVRGITDVKTINNQDFDTNNVNDLISDGEHNYIHRKKKDKSEEYHNLTDNIKTISSDNTDLLSVTNYNKSNNTATLHPQHDAQKEQVIESTRDTITITHGTNGTPEKTRVDTNPKKVLEHENLKAGNNISIIHNPTTNDSTVLWSDEASNRFESALSDINVLKDSKENKLQSLARTINIISAPEPQNKSVIDVNPSKVALLDNIQAGDNVSVTKSGNVVTISAISGISGLSPEYRKFESRESGYTVFKEDLGVRIAYTIEVFQGEGDFTIIGEQGYPEFTVIGDLKTELLRLMSPVKTLTNGSITLKYDGSNLKIITKTSQLNGVEQGTFSFYKI